MQQSVFVFISYLYFDILKMDPFEAGLKFSVTFFSGSSAGVSWHTNVMKGVF